MKVELYQSVLCPRCFVVARELNRLLLVYPDLEIEKIEVLANAMQAWQVGVRAVPTLKIGKHMLSGWIITPAAVRSFIADHRDNPADR